jgi:hypothetical protein
MFVGKAAHDAQELLTDVFSRVNNPSCPTLCKKSARMRTSTEVLQRSPARIVSACGTWKAKLSSVRGALLRVCPTRVHVLQLLKCQGRLITVILTGCHLVFIHFTPCAAQSASRQVIVFRYKDSELARSVLSGDGVQVARTHCSAGNSAEM